MALIVALLAVGSTATGSGAVANFDSLSAGVSGNLVTDGGILFQGPFLQPPATADSFFVIQLRINVFSDREFTAFTPFGIDNFRVQFVPEPATSALLMVAAITLFTGRHRHT